MKTLYLATSIFFFVLLRTSSVAQLPLFDGFETGTISGIWTISGNTAVSTTNPATGIYCLEGPSTWGINCSLATSNITFLTVEFRAKSSQTNTISMIFRVKDQLGGTAAGMFFKDDGYIYITDSSGPNSSIQAMSYSTDGWYYFQFEFDFVNQTYDLHINNNFIADDYQFYSPNVADPWLFTWSSVAQSGIAWLDDVNIYTGTVGIQEKYGEEMHSIYFDKETQLLYVRKCTVPIKSIEIYDSNGMQVRRMTDSAGEQKEDISSLASGIYLCRIETQNGVKVERFVK